MGKRAKNSCRICMLVIPVLFLVISCSGKGGDNSGGIVVPDREAVEEANRYLVQKDRERIEKLYRA
jgi:hypothetical protein